MLQIKPRLDCCIHSNSLRRAVAVMRRRKWLTKSKLRRCENRDIRANNPERRRHQRPQGRKEKEEERERGGKKGEGNEERGCKGEREGRKGKWHEGLKEV